MSSTRTAVRLLLVGSVVFAAACQDTPATPLAPDEIAAEARIPDHVQERLEGLHRTVSDAVLSMPGAVFTAPDPETNRIVLGFENLNQARGIQRSLAARGISENDYVVQEAEPIHFMSTSLRTVHRPTQGGIQIQGSGGYYCTLGFNVSHSGGRSFITNSHCTDSQGSNSGTRYYQSTSSNSAIVADEVHDPAYWTGGACPSNRRCRYSDASRALYRSGTSSNRGYIAKTTGVNNGSLTVNGRFTITSQNNTSNTFSGTLNKVGRTTGWSRGNVTSTCANVNVSGTNITLLCQTMVAASVAGGDSGSPVFRVTSGNDVQLVGILWGGGSSTFVFSPLQLVRQELGTMTATR
jgi:hypothetical protein